MAAKSKSSLFSLFTTLNNKGRLILLLTFIVVFVFLLQKVRNSDIAKSEPVFRRTLKRVASSSDEFCLVSYNILADVAIKKYVYGYRPLPIEEKLNGDNPRESPRHRQLMKELRWLNPDIINLQEVDTSYFALLEEELVQSDLKGIHKVHHNQQGLATFYNSRKFHLKRWVSYYFNDLLKLVNLGHFIDPTQNQRVVLFSHLVNLKTGKSIVIADLHSMFGMWTRPDIQALQISLFFQKLYEFVTSQQNEQPLPWIISGDFNTYPYFPLYDIISTGNVSNNGIDRLNPNKYKYPQVVKKPEIKEELTAVLKEGRKYLNHPFKDAKSAYKTVLGQEPPLTHYQINDNFPEVYGFDVMKGTLDYIWYSSSTLRVNAVLQHVKEDVIKALVACPNKYFPSDHLSMKACFGFRNA